MTPKQLKQTLMQTLEIASPSSYKRMSRAGTLEQFVESLMAQYEQSVEDGRQSALNELAGSKNPNKAAELNSLFAQIEETALNKAAETIYATIGFSQAS